MHRRIFTMVVGVMVCLGISAAPVSVSQLQAADYHNPAVPGEDTAAYWIDRGGLLATYGNFPEAIKAYNKALALNPDSSIIYYDLALAYGENGEYESARVAIDRAITMEPDNGRFYYGRAWVLLKAVGPEKARGDFLKAAELGDRNALDYLQGIGVKSVSIP